MNRRQFLRTSTVPALLAGNLPTPRPTMTQAAPAERIMTVRGAIPLQDAGLILPHEHVMSLFGAEQAAVPQYDRERLLGQVEPYLRYIRALGAQTLADCTAAYFGRAPQILRNLSEATGLNILTNTGYYGAANDRYVPQHAFQEPAEELAARWIKEWKEGIDGSGVRPGFIKLGVDPGPLSSIDRKLVNAAALTHLECGLAIAAHTGDNDLAALEQLAILQDHGVSANAWIWVHAHQVSRIEVLLEAAERGAWIELDGLAADTLDRHFELVTALRQRGHLNRLLLSHDGNSFRANLLPPKHYDFLFTAFLPRLEAAGFTRQEIGELTVGNPARALAIGVRRG